MLLLERKAKTWYQISCMCAPFCDKELGQWQHETVFKFENWTRINHMKMADLVGREIVDDKGPALITLDKPNSIWLV